jgi:hypothetical protein
MEFRRVPSLPPYVFEVTEQLKLELRRAGEDVVDLGFGNPDLASPPAVVEKLVEAAAKPHNHRYSASRGIPKLRSAICDLYRDRFGVELDPETQALTTIGAKEGLSHLMWVLVQPGDAAVVLPVRGSYRGLAIANDGVTTRLYAANFGQGTVDVFDQHFVPATLGPGAFTDPNLPAGFVPFNVQTLGNHVFVTYAQKNGKGGGVVDSFNLDGTSVTRIAVNGPTGPLDVPWGLAIAPSSFGSLAGMLLVANHGNGIIDVFDPAGTNALLAELADPAERRFEIDGLWGLEVGNGTNGGDANSVLFTAGLNGAM